MIYPKMISIYKFKYNSPFSNEEEKIRKEVYREVEVNLKNLYHNKLKEILCPYQEFHTIYSYKDIEKINKLISKKLSELDKNLKNKGLKYPYENLTYYLNLSEIQFKIINYKEEIKNLIKEIEKYLIKKEKIRNEILYGITEENIKKEREELFRLYEIERKRK